MGKNWRLRVLTKKKYIKKHDDASVAVTMVYKRRIDLSPLGRDLETILHELIHAYLAECCTHSSDLDVDALEEIYCELFSKRGKEIQALGEKLHTAVKRRKR